MILMSIEFLQTVITIFLGSTTVIENLKKWWSVKIWWCWATTYLWPILTSDVGNFWFSCISPEHYCLTKTCFRLKTITCCFVPMMNETSSIGVFKKWDWSNCIKNVSYSHVRAILQLIGIGCTLIAFLKKCTTVIQSRANKIQDLSKCFARKMLI